MGFDSQWTRYVGDRLSPAQAQSFYKNVHGIEEVLNVFTI